MATEVDFRCTTIRHSHSLWRGDETGLYARQCVLKASVRLTSKELRFCTPARPGREVVAVRHPKPVRFRVRRAEEGATELEEQTSEGIRSFASIRSNRLECKWPRVPAGLGGGFASSEQTAESERQKIVLRGITTLCTHPPWRKVNVLRVICSCGVEHQR